MSVPMTRLSKVAHCGSWAHCLSGRQSHFCLSTLEAETFAESTSMALLSQNWPSTFPAFPPESQNQAIYFYNKAPCWVLNWILLSLQVNPGRTLSLTRIFPTPKRVLFAFAACDGLSQDLRMCVCVWMQSLDVSLVLAFAASLSHSALFTSILNWWLAAQKSNITPTLVLLTVNSSGSFRFHFVWLSSLFLMNSRIFM